MDRLQHLVQDAAEHYAVLVMQEEAERLGIALKHSSPDLLAQFHSFFGDELTLDEFESGSYRKYKINADSQLPAFVGRLSKHFQGKKLSFTNVEKEFRNQGLKGDFLITVEGLAEPIAVSLKNYVGAGGIRSPQVAAGTFASFAASFIFDRIGVGKYADPRTDGASFSGSSVVKRDAVLEFMGRSDLAPLLHVLDRLQAEVREEFLGPDCEFHDADRVAKAARRVAAIAIKTVLEIFERLGLEKVRTTFLARIGMDGKEEALYFDDTLYIDSITNKRYHDLRLELNSAETRFEAYQHKQGIRFEFSRNESVVLAVTVPFTINTNGAWYRPTVRYEGTVTYMDKGHPVELVWGQRRPHKSKEIATSVNTYLKLAPTGIFDAA